MQYENLLPELLVVVAAADGVGGRAHDVVELDHVEDGQH